MIVSTAVMCLALNIYHEARGEPIVPQYHVALVTMNRANRIHENVCAEVFRPKQFSWTTGVRKVEKGWLIPKHLVPKELRAFGTANAIASATLKGRMPDLTQGATHYHTKAVSPAWAYKQKPVKIAGSHVFYRLPYKSFVTRQDES